MKKTTVTIHGKEYLPVSERIKKFRKKYTIDEGWSITTEILQNSKEEVLIKAIITNQSQIIIATGHACEQKIGRINSTNAVENCETSAIGRALASAGFLGDSFASADELVNKLEKDKLIQELRMRIRDMLLISEQHRSILGAEITDRKRLEKEVSDLKVQMSEYLSVSTRGAGSVS